jgi:hypothetical protein
MSLRCEACENYSFLTEGTRRFRYYSGMIINELNLAENGDFSHRGYKSDYRASYGFSKEPPITTVSPPLGGPKPALRVPITDLIGDLHFLLPPNLNPRETAKNPNGSKWFPKIRDFLVTDRVFPKYPNSSKEFQRFHAFLRDGRTEWRRQRPRQASLSGRRGLRESGWGSINASRETKREK